SRRSNGRGIPDFVFDGRIGCSAVANGNLPGTTSALRQSTVAQRRGLRATPIDSRAATRGESHAFGAIPGEEESGPFTGLSAERCRPAVDGGFPGAPRVRKPGLPGFSRFGFSPAAAKAKPREAP